jgi:predicted nucleic acid-binding protein
MPAAGRRFVLDSNIFIRAARDRSFSEELERFHAAFAPFEAFSAVVVQELRAGVRGADAQALEKAIFAPFEKRNRLIVPSYSAWKVTGAVLSELVGDGKQRWTTLSRSFVNDVLLAMSCRESGAMLVTLNESDFAMIAGVRPFDFSTPWPEVS